MPDDRRIIAEERDTRRPWIQRMHRSHPLLAFVFLDLAVFAAVVGLLLAIPVVTVRWSTAAALLIATVVTWIVLVFERPPRPGLGRR